MRGAQEAGAQTSLVHLYDIGGSGCRSCFACKLKNAKTNGLCAVRDGMTPALEQALQADVIVIGSPIYFDYPTAPVKAFIERLMFPVSAYLYDDNGHAGKSLVDRLIPTAMLYTMNMPKQWFDQSQYPTVLGTIERYLSHTYGYSETLCSHDTLQFRDYSRYDITTFKEADKLAHRNEQFPKDLQSAYELGKRLTLMAIKAKG